MSLDLPTVTVDGKAAHYAEAGEPGGPGTLVLLHAFPLGVGMWRPQLAAFPGWRVVAPALPGFDGTLEAATPTVEAFVRHALAVLDALEVGRAVFCGLSMGGYVTLAAWRLDPDRFAGAVLADTRSDADTAEARAARAAMRERLRVTGQAGVAAEMLSKLLGASTPSVRPEVVDTVRRLIAGQTIAGIDGALQAIMSRPDSTELLAGLWVPTLVVVGEEDTLTPPAEAERIQAGVPGATFVRIPGAGHLSNLENPNAFNAALRGFLMARGS